MITPTVADVIACPSCKLDLHREEHALRCVRCNKEYPIIGGIPSLFPASSQLTVNPENLRTKTKLDAIRTISDMSSLDNGLVKQPRSYYLAYFLLVVFLIFKFYWGVMLLLLGFFVDWIAFRRKRSITLDRFARNPLRLRTIADHYAVDELYRREGMAQPTMSDWVQLSREASGASWRGGESDIPDDERYLDILRIYRERALVPEVVVDVGANDGRACYEFGIGKDKTYIGIDVSRLLLEEFKKKNPDQTAIHADGGCLPLKDDGVDFLFCTETLEHFTNPDEAVHEFLRVLKPGGWMMIQSPNAHRIRNLNLFHIVILFISLITERLLQKKTVHENTWHNATTYHWDFSIQDYQRMIRSQGARILELRSCGFPFPKFLVSGRRDLFRRKERFFGSIPFVRYFGSDLVLVVEKEAIQPVVDPLARRISRAAHGLAKKPC